MRPKPKSVYKAEPSKKEWAEMQFEGWEGDQQRWLSAQVSEDLKPPEIHWADGGRTPTDEEQVERYQQRNKTAPQVKPASSTYRNLIGGILEADQGAQVGLAAGFTLTPADTSHMNGLEKTGYYLGEMLGVAGAIITGEAETIAVSKIVVTLNTRLSSFEKIMTFNIVRVLKPLEETATLKTNISSRTTAAMHVREAKSLLRGIGLTPSQRNQILYSFDLETFQVEHVLQARQEYRLFDDSNSKLIGRYVSSHFLEDQTERIVKFALPKNSATRLGIVDIPKGSIVFTGRVGSQIDVAPGLIGGETQTFLFGSLEQYKFKEIIMPKPNLTMRINNGSH